ncbi:MULTISPECIES: hypothetical protein [unclassified Burkholderia]|uniref:hypothetical protein n=1 Tax=unclassified Burkholderia TaxID=2613784 RepID=UPI00075BFB27|nr:MULTISPECIES: hypothetical protein [unclassified Burkholderia]KUY55260.1 hypothetical protein WS45_02715 [Burkholderia sp. RF2-non_BP3]KUY83075.1 hypothetical protein WS46_12895 [Burkholderia sp. RF4-BP95]KUY90156.1 hypothetical protein WS49_29820 [Burkholderia sp. RF7-non_BP4]KUZ03391.1 hypothetical protein WS48_02020 [Burkholderia sp. RF7-non_BP1]
MNQGKKSVAHRSTRLETQIRRVLQAAGSTICGVIARGAVDGEPADFTKPSCGRRVSIVAAFPQQKLSQ